MIMMSIKDLNKKIYIIKNKININKQEKHPKIRRKKILKKNIIKKRIKKVIFKMNKKKKKITTKSASSV
jgi:hypothetical protein